MTADKMFYDTYHCPLCEIILVGNQQGLKYLHLDTGNGRKFKISSNWIRNKVCFEQIKTQLAEYFQGSRQVFNVELDLSGTTFQKKVWAELCKIPYGQVSTYKDIAKAVGNEKASRAVGMANSKNPVPLIVPCHRVIGSNRKLVGFAHGLQIKSQLLELEGYSCGTF